MGYRSYSWAQASGTSSIDPGKPTGTVSSDVLIAEVTGQIGSASLPVLPPTGWNLFLTFADTNAPSYYYWALGSVASTSFGFTASPSGCGVRIESFSGIDNTSPIRASTALQYADGNPNITAASLTANAGDSLMVGWSNPGGMTLGALSGVTNLATTTTSYNGYTTTQDVSYLDGLTAGATTAYTRTAGSPYSLRNVATIILAAASVTTSDPSASTSHSRQSNRHTAGLRR